MKNKEKKRQSFKGTFPSVTAGDIVARKHPEFSPNFSHSVLCRTVP